MFCRSVPHSVIPSEEHIPLAEDVTVEGPAFSLSDLTLTVSAKSLRAGG